MPLNGPFGYLYNFAFLRYPLAYYDFWYLTILEKRDILYNMVIAELIRLEENFEYGTFGVLKLNKRVFCVTLELPDKQNQSNISSIPAQQYQCQKKNSPNFGETYEILNVPGRFNVLFHAGNVVDHTKGCIILGQYFGKLKGNRAVLNSGTTFKRFMQLLQGEHGFHLTVKEVY